MSRSFSNDALAPARKDLIFRSRLLIISVTDRQRPGAQIPDPSYRSRSHFRSVRWEAVET